MEHGKAVCWLWCYQKGTQKNGLIFMPDPSSGLKVYVDAFCAGNRSKEEAADDCDTARLRHGNPIWCAGCPIN